jgi:hypothetical protein
MVKWIKKHVVSKWVTLLIYSQACNTTWEGKRRYVHSICHIFFLFKKMWSMHPLPLAPIFLSSCAILSVCSDDYIKNNVPQS